MIFWKLNAQLHSSCLIMIIHFQFIFIWTHYFCDELMIIQFQILRNQKNENSKNDKFMKVFILYDSVTFNSVERRYSTYKRKLCALIKFVSKYDYFCKHSRNRIIIHIDHKPLVRFFRADCHEGIYEHWTNKLRKLNLEIAYISTRKNRITDGLFKIIFRNEDCFSDSVIEKTAIQFEKKKRILNLKKWKKKYQKFLNRFRPNQLAKMIDQNTFLKKNVFQAMIVKLKECDLISDVWNAIYRNSSWFETIYRILSNENSELSLNAENHWISNWRQKDFMKTSQTNLLILHFEIKSPERIENDSW